MFSIYDSGKSASGLNRREFLRIGSLALGGLSLPGLLAAQTATRKMVRDRAVVLLMLQGGPPQVETFDPKPDAPANVRSATGQVQTRLPGVQFGGTFPKMAALADRLAVVRSFGSGFGSHEQGPILTGNNSLDAPMGSLYSRLAGSLHPRLGMPSNTLVLPESIDPAIKLNEPTGPFTYGYVVKNYIPAGKLGAGYDAFLASGGSQLMSNLQLKLPREQFDDRRQLLTQLDSFQRQLDKTRDLSSLDAFQQQAYDVLLRGVSQAFDLSKEDPKTIDRYDTSRLFNMEDWHKGGSKHNNWRNLSRTTNLLGKQMLLARRLCEAGCGFVTVVDSCWDFHGDGNNPPVPVGMPLLGPQLDHAVAAFLEDVHERGLSDKILLIITGEMGRSPQKNSKNGGTGHWKDLTPLVLAGGGLKMGQVIGKTDRDGGKATSGHYGPENLLATAMQTLFDSTEVRVASDVPPNVAKLITDTKPIAELF